MDEYEQEADVRALPRRFALCSISLSYVNLGWVGKFVFNRKFLSTNSMKIDSIILCTNILCAKYTTLQLSKIADCTG